VRCSLCFLAFLFLPINLTAVAFVPKERMNNATGMSNLARNIGGSVGISLVTTLQARRMHRHQVRLIENLSPVNPRYMAIFSFIDVVWIMGVPCLAMIPLMFVLKNSPSTAHRRPRIGFRQWAQTATRRLAQKLALHLRKKSSVLCAG
jgi:hypothetical protein